MIQIHSGEVSRPLATSSLVRSLLDLIKARFARFRHYSIGDQGTYERPTWSKSVHSVEPCLNFVRQLQTKSVKFTPGLRGLALELKIRGQFQ